MAPACAASTLPEMHVAQCQPGTLYSLIETSEFLLWINALDFFLSLCETGAEADIILALCSSSMQWEVNLHA